MRKIRFFIAVTFMVATLTSWADVIIKSDGSSFPCFNIEKSEKYIFYTETSENPEAIKRIPIEEVYGIKRGSNPIEVIGNQTSAASISSEGNVVDVPADGTPVMREPKAASDN